MKKINSRGKSRNLLTTILVMAAAVFGFASCEKYDLEETTPEWLGASIYDYLADNGYDTYVQIIDALGYKDVLSRTGSKTIFVADEEAVQRFFDSGIFKKANGEPVASVKDMSLAQMKMLLYGSMLNNVYQVAMLSSTEGTPPTQGDCMRRVASLSIWDSVPLLTPAMMPNNKYWAPFKANNKSVRCLNDETQRPIVFFTNKFLTMKKITDDDYDFLFNQGKFSRNGVVKPGRETRDASVNGIRIKEQNVKCFNGFIHVMDEVIYPLPNMADYLDGNPNTSIYNALLERFCAPFYQFGSLTDDGKSMTREWNENISKVNGYEQVDTLWQKRFFSKRSHEGNDVKELETDAYGRSANGVLKFDPAWNSYYSATSSTTGANVAMQQNMGVMLVPDNKAMTAWWLSGGGVDLRERYHALEKTPSTVEEVIEDMAGIPDNVIVPLLNNNMLNSFVSSVPSKFANVLDDANDPMGITVSQIDSVKMCCNGAIYFTNYVFSPAEYRSVSFPTLVNKSLQILNWDISADVLGFNAYLNSMVATYSFFVPRAMYVPGISEDCGGYDVLLYKDPVSGGEKYTQMFAFYYDEDPKTPLKEKVKARIYAVDEDGNIGERFGDATLDQVKDRLEDLLDYHIVIGDVEDGYEYYQTKGRGTVKVDMANMLVYGGYQLEKNQGLKIQQVYDKLKDNGNGRTYLIDEPLASSYNSVNDILSDSIGHPEFSIFNDMMSPFYENERNGNPVGGMNVNTFNTYHYTVYAPSDKVLAPMIENCEVLDWNKIAELEEYYQTLEEDSVAYSLAMTRLSKALRTDVVKDLKASKYASTKIWNPKDANYTAFWNEAKALLDKVETTSADSNYVYSYYINEDKGSMGILNKQLSDFVKYHIQDNSVYIGGEFKIDTIHVSDPYAHYETAYMNSRQQFEKLAVRSHGGEITIIDAANKEHRVLTSDPNYYNIMCRDYEFKKEGTRASMLETSSFAVVHMIDTPLSNGIEFTYYKF